MFYITGRNPFKTTDQFAKPQYRTRFLKILQNSIKRRPEMPKLEDLLNQTMQITQDQQHNYLFQKTI